MKNQIKFIVLAIAITSSAAYANQFENCKVITKAAETIMDGRQNGTSAADFYENIEKNVKDAQAKKILMILVKEAYKTPKFSTAEYKLNAINEFKNECMVACMAK